jgi:hypothetical protein
MDCLKTIEYNFGHYDFTCTQDTGGECYYENNPDKLLEIAETMQSILEDTE